MAVPLGRASPNGVASQTAVRRLAALLALAGRSAADSYLHNPRGSNNKLSEQNNNVENDNRLFDSQNNGQSGYHIGDNCKPVCQDANQNYDATKEGAMQGIMTYYQGSELYIEWVMQHGCGIGHPNLRCQIIFQYMSEKDNPGIRDGTKRGNQNTAGGQQEPPTQTDAMDTSLGQHEPLQFYLDCKARERNKGLYTADQNMNNNAGATATRQNANGNNNANDRHGLECPEERDYYPYWHPSPWHDIAILTDDPVTRCPYYLSESQNVKGKGYCSNNKFNNPRACSEGGGSWQTKDAFGEPPPDCVGIIQSRDNHNGNVRNGNMMYYVWKIPKTLEGRAVFRLRYNITTGDMEPGAMINQDGPATDATSIDDPFFIDAKFNDPNPGNRRRSPFRSPPVIGQNAEADWVNLQSITNNKSRSLRLEMNTNQIARVFEDRTHTFYVKPRPSDVPTDARIVNYNVRGRRGNIVQVYPANEYDFVPPNLVVEAGDYLHFQWAGSDANPKGNAGNGRAGTDRSNIVQIQSSSENVPIPLKRHTLFFDAANTKEGSDDWKKGIALVDKFAYLNQDAYVACDPKEDDNNALDQCKQLNGASAYFDGGLVQLNTVGVHHIASTRNNQFSNRSQKATITVLPRSWSGGAIAGLVIGLVVGIALLSYLGVCLYAFMRPTSWLFSTKYRPRLLKYIVKKDVMDRKLKERKEFKQKELARYEAMMADPPWEKSGLGKPGQAKGGMTVVPQAGGVATSDAAAEAELAKPAPKYDKWVNLMQRCKWLGLQEQRLVVIIYTFMNIGVFLIGFLSNLDAGFQGSMAFPFAKGSGYTLDMNFAVLIIPTLKSLQTALRGAGASREWLPFDDPITFHITVAFFIAIGSAVHIICHFVEMSRVANAPKFLEDVYKLWGIQPPDEAHSGMTWANQIFNPAVRGAGFTGFLIFAIMAAMYSTALDCSRRATNCVTRRIGGYNVFWKVHGCWQIVYILLLIHAPTRLWIWFFFPALLVLIDRMMLAGRQRPYAALKRVTLLPRDVIALTFDVPPGFAYEAGSYIHLGWRNEWHPFTLTSAPEENILSVHIRAADQLDWCSALRRVLMQQEPANPTSENIASFVPQKYPVNTTLEFVTKIEPRTGKLYCVPVINDRPPTPTDKSPAKKGSFISWKGKDAKKSAKKYEAQGEEAGKDAEKPKPKEDDDMDVEASLKTIGHLTPPDAIVLQLGGPFGAPAQKVWQFDTIMAVGAGIGVTPFASILRSVQLRARQKQLIINAAGGGGSGKNLQPGGKAAKGGETPRSNEGSNIDQLLPKFPKRIYFYWIVRSQEEIFWFQDLLAAACEGPAKGSVNISVFISGEIELSRVKKMDFAQQQYFGRPNWQRIFKANKEAHPGEHIGVFLCGSPAIGTELAENSAKFTDPPDMAMGTRFSFFKEHF